MVTPYFFRICKIFFFLNFALEADVERRIFNKSYRRPPEWAKRIRVSEAPELTCVPLKETFLVTCPTRRESSGFH